MQDKDKIKIISKLLSGYTILSLNNKKYIIDTPTDSLINESWAVYEDTIDKNKYEALLREEHLFLLLVKNRLLSIDYDKEQRELSHSLDESKKILYKSLSLPKNQIKRIRDNIQVIKNTIHKQQRIRHSLDRYTIEGLAEYAAEQYIFSNLILDENYNKISVTGVELDSIINLYKSSLIDVKILREIARTEPFRSIVSVSSNPFRVVWEEQRLLNIFYKMYNNVYEHPECPPDYIIEDDDVLDGWFLVQKEEREKNRTEKNKDVLTERHKNASEIFLITNNQEEIQEIEQMNDTRAKVIKARRNNQLLSQGYSKDNEILELVLEAQNG